MRVFAPRGDATATSARRPAAALPASCPACRSASIVTAAKRPDGDSYWRCTGCGEVWNDQRRQAPPSGAYRWR